MKYIIRLTTLDSVEEYLCYGAWFSTIEEKALALSLEAANKFFDFMTSRHRKLKRIDICEKSSGICVRSTIFNKETT